MPSVLARSAGGSEATSGAGSRGSTSSRAVADSPMSASVPRTLSEAVSSETATSAAGAAASVAVAVAASGTSEQLLVHAIKQTAETAANRVRIIARRTCATVAKVGRW